MKNLILTKEELEIIRYDLKRVVKTKLHLSDRSSYKTLRTLSKLNDKLEGRI